MIAAGVMQTIWQTIKFDLLSRVNIAAHTKREVSSITSNMRRTGTYGLSGIVTCNKSCGKQCIMSV